MGIWKPQLTKWRQFPEREGLLLFAQSLIELLFHHTADSFRARALNLHSLVRECQSTANAVIAGDMKQGTLVPLIEELNHRISKGSVTGHRKSSVFAQYQQSIGNKKADPKQFQLSVSALRAELASAYWNAICSDLRSEVAKGVPSQRIVELADAFISEAEYRGWDRQAIFSKAKWFFFESRYQPEEIASADALDSFLAEFNDPAEVDFVCLFRASEDIREASEILEKANVQVLDTPPDRVPGDGRSGEFLSHQSSLPLYVVVSKVKCFDQVTARKDAERRLHFVVNLHRIQKHEFQPKWSDACLVYEAETLKRALIQPPSSPMMCGNSTRQKSIGISASEFTKLLMGGHLTTASRSTVYNLLEYHKAALDTQTPENQLLNLWSGIEGMVPSPFGDKDRVLHFVDMILPSLTLSYIGKHISYLSESFTSFDESIEAYLRANGTGDSIIENCAAVLCCGDLSAERQGLLAMLGSSPLLKLRAEAMAAKLRSPADLKDVLEQRRRWVGWQIQRIYSARNRIVHNARRVSYLPTLVENLHGYFDTMFAAVIRLALTRDEPTSVSATLQALRMHEAAYLADLGKKEAFDKSNFRQLVFGSANPISPFEVSVF